jgi:hypothetical protein
MSEGLTLTESGSSVWGGSQELTFLKASQVGLTCIQEALCQNLTSSLLFLGAEWPLLLQKA